MAKPHDAIPHLLFLFEQQPCWTIQPLCQQLRYSAVSVRRFLYQVGYYSSFTHNGAWYTLGSIPNFNRQGLWFYQDIGFSKAGSLTATLIRLIRGSQAGMSAAQVGENLRCRCHSVLVNLHRQGRLQRQKLGRTYIYFAADRQTADNQRKAMALQNTVVQSLPAEIAVIILAEHIKRPRSNVQQLAEVIAAKGVRVSPLHIEKLFAAHGLKKTT